MLESLLNKVAGPEAFFPVNIAKALRTAPLQNSSGGCY